MKRVKIIALFGKSGSGKDTLLKEIVKICRPGFFNTIVSYTSRPKRENEIEGVNYHFISKEEFETMIKSNLMLETSFFNEWWYGTSKVGLKSDKINIGVFNLDGIKSLKEKEDIELIPIYIDCSDKTRLLRQLNRENNPNVKEIVRRFWADEEDFENWEKICPEAKIISTENVEPEINANLITTTYSSFGQN